MAVQFTLDDTGFLQWEPTADAPLSMEEARIVATAEIAQALRFIGETLHEAVDAMQARLPPRPIEPI